MKIISIVTVFSFIVIVFSIINLDYHINQKLKQQNRQLQLYVDIRNDANRRQSTNEGDLKNF